MQRRIAVLAVVLLAVTAGCSTLVGTANPDSSPQSADEVPGGASDTLNDVAQPSTGEGRTVAVGASGQVQTDPDRAVVRVAVTARADSVETVRQRLAENASRMRSALEEGGIGSEQVTSARFDIGRNYEHEERPEAPKFRGHHAFVVTVDETDRAGTVVVTTVQNGATSVEEVEFTITPETRRDLRERALARAVGNARAEATVVANGTGLELDGVRTVGTADVSTRPILREDVAFATGGDGGGGGVPTSFEGGRVTVTAEGTVVYNASAT